MAWAPPKVGQRKNSIITSIITEGAERGWSDKYLQRQLKAVLPLTARQRTAVTVYRRSLREQGVPPARVTMLVERYMDKLKNQRAAAVARTERKKLETELLHRTIGELPLEREWTSQSGCCVVCKALTGMRTTTVYGPGLPGPPAHPNCRCSEKIHKLTSRVTSGVYKAHDGDGDQWVHDATEAERPKGPGDTPKKKDLMRAAAAARAHRTPRRSASIPRRRKAGEPAPLPEPTKPHADHTIDYTPGVPADVEGMQQAGETAEENLRQMYQMIVGGPRIKGAPHFDQIEGFEDEMSEDEFVAAVTDMARGDMTSGDLMVRVPLKVLGALQRDGRFRTQHEDNVGTVSGVFDPGWRAKFEHDNMGAPKDMDPTKRPVYGTLETDGGFDMPAPQYGEVTLILKSSVRERTTVSLGDTLNYGTYPIAMGDVETADRTRILAAVGRGNLLSYAQMITDPDAPVSDGVDCGEPDEYKEVQIHGGVNLSDVDTVSPTTYTGEDDAKPLEDWASTQQLKYWDGI